MKINIITIFPDFFRGATSYSILKRAQDKDLLDIEIFNLRDWSADNYQTIDDKPYGGGPGMVMMVEPVYKALEYLKFPKNVVVPSAKGIQWNQNLAYDFSHLDELTFIVPHFEGIDERVTEHLVDFEISVGPYVVSGGELPTMTMIDSIARLIPGVLGNPESLAEESFSMGNSSSSSYIRGEEDISLSRNQEPILEDENSSSYLKRGPGGVSEYPQYTRPSAFTTPSGEVWAVPDVLISGDHQKIKEWRKKHSK